MSPETPSPEFDPMPHSPEANAPDVTDPSSPARARRALLSTKRDELLTPVQAIIDVSDRVLTDAKALENSEFIEDLQRMRGAAVELRCLILDVLGNTRLDSIGSEADSHAFLSRIRHDMLNKLNPVINYSEM